jgi:hypothetical protein
MARQTTLAALVAFLVAAAAGFLFSGRDAAASTPVTVAPPGTTLAGPLEATFIQPGETVIGPAVVVATDLRLDGEQVILDFEVQSLAPVADSASVSRMLGFQLTEDIPPEELDTVYLDHWVLLTPTGEIPGSVANPSARTARFDVGPGFSLNSVTEVRLASYALLVPIDAVFALDLDNDVASIAPGITARLLAVTEQALTIVQVEVLSERSFNYDNIGISGSGPGWKSAVREAEGRPRWNLTYDSATAPSPIELKIYGSVWMTIEDDSPVLVGTES